MNIGRAKIIWTTLSILSVLAIMAMQFFGTPKFTTISTIFGAFLGLGCCILSFSIFLYAGNLINKMWGRINGLKLTIGFKMLLSIFTFASSLYYLFLLADWTYNPAVQEWRIKLPMLVDCWAIFHISILVNYLLYTVDSVFDLKEAVDKETAKFIAVPQFGDLALTMGFMTDGQVNKIAAMQEQIKNGFIEHFYKNPKHHESLDFSKIGMNLNLLSKSEESKNGQKEKEKE